MRTLSVFFFFILCIQLSGQNSSGATKSEWIVCDYPVFPSFPGEENAFSDYLKTNIQYPDSARKHRKQGTVYVYFEIDTNGVVRNAKVHKGVEGAPELDVEALRVITLMPKWKPGNIDCSVPMVVPIKFTLSEDVKVSLPCDTSIYKFVEEMPSFPGDAAEFQNYLKRNLHWPDSAKGGTAYTSFVVKCDGSISDVSCVGGDPYFGKECVRVISAMPAWNPGRMDDVPVNVKMVVPIHVLPQ